MLLRIPNVMGYTNYPNIVVHKFCKQDSKSGVDIFRIFDSINYIENLKLGFDAAGSASGFGEGTLSYTGDILDTNKGKYNLAFSNCWTCTLTIFRGTLYQPIVKTQ